MNGKEIQIFKSYLLSQKSSILNKTHEFKSDQLSLQEVSGDDAELASRDLSMNVSLHLHERDRAALMQIDRALGKIENGTYGHCESCDAQIGAKRLEARPFAVLCIDCMEEQEQPRPLPH